MKRLDSLNVGFALQIFAVILLFGYPGCSSKNNQNDLKTTGANMPSKEISSATTTSNFNKPAVDSLILFKKWQPDLNKTSLDTWSYK